LGSVNFTLFLEVLLAIGTPHAGKVLVTPLGNSSNNAVRTAVTSSLVASDYSGGWVVSKTYSNDNLTLTASCGLEALILLQALPSGRCLPRYALSNDTLRAVGFKKYFCERGELT